MHPTKRTAHVAGLLYLFVTITGMFALMYVPGRLFVRGNSAATANNILAHQSLFMSDIVVGLVSELLFIAVVLVLYQLLKGVNQQHAALMVILVLIDAPLAFLGAAFQMATLAFLRGPDFLTVFNKPQRDALAMLFFNLDKQVTIVSEIFWGLWLLPLGLLVFRSGFLPRFLGVWLIINGFAYVALSFTGLLLPQHVDMVFSIATPAFLGEMAFMLWLLIRGAKVQQSMSAPPATSLA
ncbi:MAG TPA: DUF4386 domain-containing protein [Thermoanaerobaculia bacterium]|nr:DUF4386 domain-containing protein [Thermoanaerobaculia bacterium]